MTTPDKLRNIGAQVMVFDSKGNYECRGAIVGRYACDPPIYDIQPNRCESLSKRLCGIPETQLRSVGSQTMAYERREPVRASTYWTRRRMTRFFYPASRAHHAYSMAIDFGMEFERRFGQKWTREGLISLTGATGYKLYVHADSLALLEPQLGDMLTNLGVIGWRLSAIDGDKLIFHDGNGENTTIGLQTEMQIIQRNGLPFHFPEQEP